MALDVGRNRENAEVETRWLNQMRLSHIWWKAPHLISQGCHAPQMLCHGCRRQAPATMPMT